MDHCPHEMRKKNNSPIQFSYFLNVSKYINKAKINLKSFGLMYCAIALLFKLG